MSSPINPIDPVEIPLITPAPPARVVARRQRSGDEGRPPPRERDARQEHDEPFEDDDGGDFPHVDVRV